MVFKKTTTNLTEGPIFSGLLNFTIPILLGSIVTQFYNIADAAIVGHFVSDNALAAVSACSPINSIINMFLIGLSTGSNVVIAQRSGAKDKDALQKAIGSVAGMTLICGTILVIGGSLGSKGLLTLLGTPEEIFSDALSYMVIVFIGSMGNLIYQMGSGALRGMGDSTRPFYFLCFCSGLNVILDLVAVLVFHLGVLGVAIATALSQFISGFAIIKLVNKGSYGITLKLKDIHFDSIEVKKVIGIGLPAGIQNVGNTVAALCVQSFVNGFGSDVISANNIVTKLDDMINIPVVALSTALCTFVGQNMGKFNMDRIKKGINTSILSLEILGIGMCAFLIGFRHILPLIFTKSTDVIEIAAIGVFIMSFQCLFHGIDRCLVMAMRGAGKSIVPMITAQFGAFSRIPLVYFLAVKTGEYKGIFVSLLIASFLRTAAIAAYYYLGGWKKAVSKFMMEHKQEN